MSDCVDNSVGVN